LAKSLISHSGMPKATLALVLFFKIVKAGFSQPTKQLLNNHSKKLKLPKEEIKIWLDNNDIDSIKRGQDLNLNDWLALTKKFPKP